MSECATLTFSGVSKAVWDDLRSIGAPYGVVIDTDAGSLDKAGFSVRWHYDAAAWTLAVQCTEHPFIVSCSTIVAQINDHVHGLMAKHEEQPK